MARDFAKAFYKSAAWQHVRRQALIRDKYLCKKPGCYNPAEEVHHIIELTPENIDDVSVSLNLDNLICLCYECHKKIHNQERIKALRKKTSRQQINILPEIIFDDNGYPIPVDTPRG